MADKRFRVVFRTDSHVRLMERPGDDPVTWNLNLEEADVGRTEIWIRDEVGAVGENVPSHLGLLIVVELDAEDLEEGIESAENSAAIALALLSAAGRAPTLLMEAVIAYDITPGADVRRIRQWFWNTPVIVGKTPVPQAVFGDLFTAFTGSRDQKLTWRISQSLSWHQRALREWDAVARFMGLWIAAEALEPRLRELFQVSVAASEQRGGIAFPGMKALAEAEGAPDDLVKEAYTLRNDLFHARRVHASDLIARARDLIPALEGLLPSAWTRLLGIGERTSDFPSLSVVPHRIGMFFDAELIKQDEAQWDRFSNHPHFLGNIEPVRNETQDARALSVSYPMNLTAQNLTGEGGTWRPRAMGIVGPSGPNVASSSEFSGPNVITAT